MKRFKLLKLLMVIFCLGVLFVGCQNINDIERSNEDKAVSGNVTLEDVSDDSNDNSNDNSDQDSEFSNNDLDDENSQDIPDEPVSQSSSIEILDVNEIQTFTRTYNEGDFIKLEPKLIDLDNDELTVKFSKPLNEYGEWKTNKGDAGTYTSLIEASDGVATTTAKVVLIIQKTNTAPKIFNFNDITVEEGEKVILDPLVSDPDEGDKVTFTFTGWMNSPEKLTDYNDAGQHKVMLTASDGKDQVSKEITVTVLEDNRPPRITFGSASNEPIQATVGQKVILNVKAQDPDGDEITIEYEEPFDSNGEWTPTENDKGRHEITVTVSDGDNIVTERYFIDVKAKNLAPVYVAGSQSEQVLVQTGETVVLTPEFYDPEGKNVEVTYEGWMNTNRKTVTQSDSGRHTVTIRASDGVEETVIVVSILVNTPPIFVDI